MEKAIRLLKNVSGYYCTYKKDQIFKSNEPEQGFNDDGTFTISGGQKIDILVTPDKFEIIEIE